MKQKNKALRKTVENLTLRDLAKLFLHGLVFSAMLTALTSAWPVVMSSSTSVGAVLGVTMGVALFILGVGFANTVITSHLWFELRYQFWHLLVHGLGVFFTLFLVNLLFVGLPTLLFPGVLTALVTFFIAAFASGFAAKKIAQILGLGLQNVSERKLAFGLGRNALAVVIELAVVFPIVWIFSASIRSYGSLLTTTLQLIPPDPTLEAYYFTLTQSAFWVWLRNSLFVCFFTTGFCILIASPASYALSRFRFFTKRPILYALIFIQFVPGLLMIIAFFQLLIVFGLYDSLLGLILIYTSLVLPFNVWNLKAFFDTIPRDIDEAALIDGASYLSALRYVVIPVSTPGLAVTAFFSFLTGWNEFALANIVLGSEENYTLPLGLYGLTQVIYQTNWPIFAAMSILSSVPLVAVFLYIQRYLRAGLAIGAVKG